MSKPYFYREWDFCNSFIDALGLSPDDLRQLVSKKIIVHIPDKRQYKWNIVGFVIIKNNPMIIFPELYKPDIPSQDLTKDDALLLLDIFKKYCNYKDLKEEEMEYLFGNSGKDESKVALSLYFFNDYKNYGLLTRKKSEIRQSASGLINWSKTTTQQIPITTHHNAFYPRPFVKLRQNNYNSIIRRLHEWILKDASDKWGWLDSNFKYEMLSDFPCQTIEEAVLILKKELRTTFVQREIKLLKNMIAYLTNTSDESTPLICDYFFTPFFHHIWERMCGYAFGNDYQNLSDQYIPTTRIRYIFPDEKTDDRHQIPDILFIHENTFCIFDAKYFQYGKFPEEPDIVKQYIYYLTIQETLKQEGSSLSIKNVFLLPGNVKNIKKFATVSTDRLHIFGTITAYYLNVELLMNIFVDKQQTSLLIERIFATDTTK